MDFAQQRTAFDQIANKARRAGILRYDRHGVLIIIQPDAPPATAPVSVPGESPGAPSLTPQAAASVPSAP